MPPRRAKSAISGTFGALGGNGHAHDMAGSEQDHSSASSRGGQERDAAPIVHVIEDDESSRVASFRVLRSAGHAVRVYADGGEFLAAAPTGAGCVVLDIHLPGLSGLDLQDRLAIVDNPLPLVFVTGQSDISKTVRAMKAGAVDFLTKPVDAGVLLEAVARAIAKDADGRAARGRRQLLRLRFNRLTPREREVFAHLISGRLNKQIGFDLGITERTVKIHRHQVIAKMEVNSIADLVRIAAALEIAPAEGVH